MSKLIITRGMSGSGKTTWAKDFCDWEPGQRVRVNRDDLRGMLHGGYLADYKIQLDLTAIQHGAVRELLRRGKTVVVDDTNLVLKHAKAFAKLAHEEGASFEVNDEFLSVSLAECIERDAGRDAVSRVGEKVIRNQYERFVNQGLQPVVYTPDSTKSWQPVEWIDDFRIPEAIIVDVDGTLADMGDRDPYDESTVSDDKPHERVVELVKSLITQSTEYGEGYRYGDDLHLIVMSGRTDGCLDDTDAWLRRELWIQDYFGSERPAERFHLHMRATGDGRSDDEVKYDLFNEHVRGKFNVRLVIDDRDKVVKMWRALGLTTLQVAEGNF